MSRLGDSPLLIVTRGFLTSLQLLQVKVADLHVTSVVSQTTGESGRIGFASTSLLLVILLLLLRGDLLLDGLRWGRGTAKHASDTSPKGVADGRTDGNAGCSRSHLAK